MPWKLPLRGWRWSGLWGARPAKLLVGGRHALDGAPIRSARVLNDEPGTLGVHPAPTALFVGGSAAATRSPNEAKTKAAITVAFESGPHHTPAQRLAFDLYSASFFQPAADARLFMLMMAIETMLDPQDRDEATTVHVRELDQPDSGGGSA